MNKIDTMDKAQMDMAKSSFISALTGSLIEIFFGIFMLINFRKSNTL